MEVPDLCPSCSHEWRRHDPEDGKCDAYPGGDHCNPFEVIAGLSRLALAPKAEEAQ